MCRGSKDDIPPRRPGVPGVLTARCPTPSHVLTAWIPASSSLCVPTHPLCLPYPYPLMSSASPCPHSILTAWCFLHTPCSLCPQVVALVLRMPLCPPPCSLLPCSLPPPLYLHAKPPGLAMTQWLKTRVANLWWQQVLLRQVQPFSLILLMISNGWMLAN